MATIKDRLAHLIESVFDSWSYKGSLAISHDQVGRIQEEYNLVPGTFIDFFARYVAHEYDAGHLSFEVADAAMNSLHAYVQEKYDVTLPSYALEVFLAFDEGEFKHHEDDESIDPESKYTKPAIRSIVIRDKVLGEFP